MLNTIAITPKCEDKYVVGVQLVRGSSFRNDLLQNPYFKKKAKAKKVKDMTCVETCQPGPRSGCTIRGKGKPAGNLSCAEVDRQLEALDVSTKYASLCLKSAIQKGLIKIKGENKEEDLAMVVHSEKHDSCGHTINATLGDLLMQPDYAGTDYEDGSMEATVVCKECEEDEEKEEGEESRTYVTGLCEGRPSFDCGKFHNHCRACPGFGMCIHDYRQGLLYRWTEHSANFLFEP